MISPTDIDLALSLFDIIKRAAATLTKLKDDSPETYAYIGKHHADALAAAEAAIDQHVPPPSDVPGPVIGQE